MTRILVLGGNRSGKSGYAESLLAGAAPVDYVATAARRADDVEWAARIRRHEQRRPAHWRTVESTDLVGVLTVDGPPVLVDSVTTWLARVLDEAAAWSEPVERAERLVEPLYEAWARSSRSAVLVSDEVGLGIVPETPSGRLFRDVLGTLNQRLAAAADEVHLIIAGLPVRLR